MKYFKAKNEIMAVDSEQYFLIQEDWIEISAEEVQIIIKGKEDKYKDSIEYKIAEAKAYLASTDFKVLPDYDKEPSEVIAKRAEAREFIRANEGVSNGL